MYKAVAIDLDGTLLRSNGSISKRTLAVLSELKKRGVEVIVCTGRNISETMDVLKECPVSPVMVLLTGALVMDVGKKQILYHSCIEAAIAKDILQLLRREKNCFCYVYFGEYLYAFPEMKKMIYQCGLNQKDIECTGRWIKYEEHLREKIAGGEIKCEKIFVMPKNSAQRNHIIRKTSGKAECVCADSGKLEIVAAGIDKAKALKLVLEYLNIRPEQVLAFGDSKNDIPLTQINATFVAMENADPELAKLSDTQTKANDADGVAIFIEELIRKKEI